MRIRRRRLTETDQLNIHVALGAKITECIAKVRDAPSQPMIEAWSREAASYISTHHRFTARNRRGTHVADQSSRWSSELCTAIITAVTRADKS